MSKKKIKRKQQYQKPKERTLKEWWQDQSEKTQKIIKIACIALIAVIALVCIWYYGIYDDGSLRVSRGAIVNAEDNWLIVEGDKGKNSKYYHVADVETPAGYTLDPDGLSASSSSLRQDLTFRSEDGVTLYVAPVSKSVTEMLDTVYATFASMTSETGEITEILDAGEGCKYFAYQYSYEDEETGGTNYIQSLVFYSPSARKNNCVLISANVYPDSEEGFRPVDELLAIVQGVLANNVTMIK